MLPEHYSTARAAKLARLKVPPIKEPFYAEIPFVQSLSFENSKKFISKKPHKHSYFEAHFVFEGFMKYSDISGEYTVKSGDGIIFSPYSEHTVREFSNDLVKMSIAFIPEKNSVFFSNIAEKPSIFVCFGEEKRHIFDDIFKEADNKSELSVYIIRNKVFDILSYVLSIHDTSALKRKTETDKNDTRIAFVKRYIADNKNTLLTCRDIADQCHFNTKYLGRIFKEHTGMTLLEYIHAEKIRQAQEYLAKGELSLSEISTALGFANEYYFNSFFKRESGMTPGLYKKLFCK